MVPNPFRTRDDTKVRIDGDSDTGLPFRRRLQEPSKNLRSGWTACGEGISSLVGSGVGAGIGQAPAKQVKRREKTTRLEIIDLLCSSSPERNSARSAGLAESALSADSAVAPWCLGGRS